MTKDGRKFSITCKNYIECEEIREKIRQVCFTVNERMDQAKNTFANSYYNAIFNSTQKDYQTSEDLFMLKNLNHAAW